METLEGFLLDKNLDLPELYEPHKDRLEQEITQDEAEQVINETSGK